MIRPIIDGAIKKVISVLGLKSAGNICGKRIAVDKAAIAHMIT